MAEQTVQRVDPAKLRATLAQVPAGAWSLPSRFADTAVHHGYRRVLLADGGRWMVPAERWAFAVAPFMPVRTAWLSQLDAGGFIIPHRDGGPFFERWHIPIQAAGWFDDTEPEDGVPFRVEHWRPHALWNDSDRPRIHLVIDRDIPVDHPPVPFTVHEVPPERAEMVARAR